MPVEDAVRDYLRLALRLGDRRPGTIIACSGDGGLLEQVRAERSPSPSALVRAAGRLAMRLPDLDLPPARERFLAAQLVALEGSARRLAGQAFPFEAELAASYDTSVALGSADGYRAAHRELDDLLPGRGDLAWRLAAHRQADEVPRDRLGVAVAALVAALQERARDAGLVAGDAAIVTAIVGGAPWSALHRREGPGRSRVLVNADVRPRRAQLARLLAHELGHHVEQWRRETVLVAQRGWREHDVVLAGTPQCLISEGAAELGMHVLVGPEWGRWACGVLGDVGLGFDGELAERIATATDRLAGVRLDAALLLHGRRARPGEVRAYLRRWLLVDDARAGRVLGFLADPRWRGHTATYVVGAPLVRRRLDRPGASPAQRLRELYDGPWTPGGLREELRRPG
jgi:hypothetical protein